MLRLRANGYDMAYVEMGQGPPLVCVHGSLCDFRVWSCVLGPLSQRHRVIAVSLRHCFPEHWDGVGTDYNMPQHIADVIAFLEALGAGPVDLLGHSRGGHLAFRVAQQRPDLLRRLVLAEPGGDLDASLGADDAPLGAHVATAAEKIAAGTSTAVWPVSSMRLKARVHGACCRPRRSRSCATTRARCSARSMISAGALPAPMLRRSACRHCSSVARTRRASCR